MPLTINTNVASLSAQRHLAMSTAGLNKTSEKLASGYRINRAGDDAAGLQLSEKLRAQIRSSKKALDNIQDGINFVNVVDGAFSSIIELLQRARELLVQAANDTYSTAGRTAIQQEITQLITEHNRIANSTKWNGKAVLTAAFTPINFRIQVGANNNINNDTLSLNNGSFTLLGDTTPVPYGLQTWYTAGVGSPLNPANFTGANIRATYLPQVDNAIRLLSMDRARAGAMMNRLESAAQNLRIGIENMSASESRIRNVDVASETATLSRNRILQQASTSILAQANQTPSLALKLLQS